MRANQVSDQGSDAVDHINGPYVLQTNIDCAARTRAQNRMVQLVGFASTRRCDDNCTGPTINL